MFAVGARQTSFKRCAGRLEARALLLVGMSRAFLACVVLRCSFSCWPSTSLETRASHKPGCVLLHSDVMRNLQLDGVVLCLIIR